LLFHMFPFKLILGLLATATLAQPASAQKKQPKPAKKIDAKPASMSFVASEASKYYRIAGLGSTVGDSANAFPYPTAILEELDTVNTHIIVRFPELGMLGITEDTVKAPAFYIGDTLKGYAPQDPLFMLTFPKTQY